MLLLDAFASTIAVEHEYKSTRTSCYDTDVSGTPTEPSAANFGSTEGLRGELLGYDGKDIAAYKILLGIYGTGNIGYRHRSNEERVRTERKECTLYAIKMHIKLLSDHSCAR